VNGKHLEHSLCKHCYEKVYFYRNEFGSIVVFDRLGAPWPRHACYHPSGSSEDRTKKTVRKIGIPGSYDLSALERRHAELLEKKRSREHRNKRRKEILAEDRKKKAEARRSANEQKAAMAPSRAEKQKKMKENKQKRRDNWELELDRKWREKQGKDTIVGYRSKRSANREEDP